MPTPGPVDAWEQAVPLLERQLSDAHRKVLEDDSGIDGDIVVGRGYYSPTTRQMAALVAAGLVQDRILTADSWLAIPVHRPDGEKHCEVMRVFGGSFPTKYVWPTGTRNALMVHPGFFADLYDEQVPLIFAEGVKKGDAILSAARREGIPCVVVALNGNYGWRCKTEAGSSVASYDFLDLPLKRRRVYTTPDSDFRTNDSVRAGWSDLAQYASAKTGARHVYVAVVPYAGLERQGADDYLAGGGTLADLLGAATTPTFALADAALDEAPPLIVKTAFTLIEEAVRDVPHLINPLLPEEGILVIGGHSGSYKTWHGLQLCLDGALGIPWLDHPDLKHPDAFSTLYVNKEMGSKMLGQRLRAIARNERYAKHSDYETVIRERIHFADESVIDFTEEIQRHRIETAILDLGVRLVILDSFSMCWTGDENSSSEVGRFYAYLRGITERTGVAWGLIHHLLKPSGTRKKDHVQFSIRGSGQIMQQADAALILAEYDQEERATDTRQLSVIHAKARTSLELPGFLSEFDTHAGAYVSMTFTGKISDVQSRVASTAKNDPKKLIAWLTTSMIAMSAMNPRSAGMRVNQLVTVLPMSWSGPTDPPSAALLKERLNDMETEGTLVVLDESKAAGGKLYRFSAGPGYDSALTLAANRVGDLLGSDTGPEDEEVNA